MAKNPDSLTSCIDARLKEFADYDQTVDIVSGFESFLVICIKMSLYTLIDFRGCYLHKS